MQSCEEVSGAEQMHRLQFSANFLIVLRAQGRIDETCLAPYNSIMKSFVNQIGEDVLQDINHISGIQDLFIYTTLGIIGIQSQLEISTSFMREVSTDDAVQNRVI